MSVVTAGAEHASPEANPSRPGVAAPAPAHGSAAAAKAACSVRHTSRAAIAQLGTRCPAAAALSGSSRAARSTEVTAYARTADARRRADGALSAAGGQESGYRGRAAVRRRASTATPDANSQTKDVIWDGPARDAVEEHQRAALAEHRQLTREQRARLA
ncbi:hypothetical protein [Brevundimonas sp.]|uniref:hypothetical protein n=1 Tax=Brevundimonas sp. TaxID=1871086 RepID=UPI002579C4F7|nr:hypothetical protein [Brevundimonas sp.]